MPFSAPAKLFVKFSSLLSLQTHRWQRDSNGVIEVFNLEVLADTDAPDTTFYLTEVLLLVIMQGGEGGEASKHLLPQPQFAIITYADRVGVEICNHKASICSLK